MLNQETRDLLKVLSAINTQVILSHPVTIIKAPGIQAVLDVENLGEAEFEEFGIYNINEFLSLVTSIPNANIELKLPKIVIKNDRQKIDYNTADIEILQENLQIKKDFLERVKRNQKVVEFKLSDEDLKQIKKIANLLSLETLKTDVENNKLILRNDEKSSNTFEIDLDFNLLTDNVDAIDFSVMLFQKVPNGNYIGEIYQNPKGNKILVLTSEEVPELSLIISPK